MCIFSSVSQFFHTKSLEKKIEICYNMLWGKAHVVGELRAAPKIQHISGGHFMKIKSVLAAFVAVAAISCTSVCAFAENADPADDQVSTVSAVADETTTDDVSDGENGAETEGENEIENVLSASVPENVSVAADPMEGNPVSGVDGAAALAGIAMVAGAALVISHKHG